MIFEPTHIPAVVKVIPRRHGDDRGFFSEIFRDDLFRTGASAVDFVQDNMSLSAEVGTVRGLHFQSRPAPQGKLIRCLAGAILDVAVDIRVGSPTYGQHVAVELTPEEGAWLWVPEGFAHGFCTLKPDTLVLYKVTGYYSQPNDKGLRWNDPALGIGWPVDEANAVLSAKDRVQPLLADLPDYFTYTA